MINYKTSKAELWSAYKEQQKTIKETKQQMQCLFGVCAFFIAMNLL